MLQDQRLSSPLLISPEGEGNEKLRRTKMTTLSGGIITTIITDHTTFFYPKPSVYNSLANYHLLISKTFLLNDKYQTMKEKTCNIVKDVQN